MPEKHVGKTEWYNLIPALQLICSFIHSSGMHAFNKLVLSSYYIHSIELHSNRGDRQQL